MWKGLPSSRYKTAKSGSDQHLIGACCWHETSMDPNSRSKLNLYWFFWLNIQEILYRQPTNGNFQPTALGPTGSVALVGTALGTASPESIRRISFVSPTISRWGLYDSKGSLAWRLQCGGFSLFKLLFFPHWNNWSHLPLHILVVLFDGVWWCLMWHLNSCNGKQWRHVFWSFCVNRWLLIIAPDWKPRAKSMGKRNNNQLMVNWWFGLVLWHFQGTLTLAIILFIRGSQESKLPINH